MKKLSYILSGLLMAGSSALFSSCGDNTDFWGPHILTDDEIAEMARQDSIKQAQRERIDADLILEYNVEFFISSNSYDGGEVKIDMDKIASEFGLDKDALGNALNGDGGPDVTGFAIEGSTHADNMTSSNSGAYWGHWWDKDGNVKNWGDEAMVFAEFEYTEGGEGIFHVGQYPGHLAVNQEVKFIEALKYQDKRVAIVITAKGIERGEVKATIVQSNKLTVEAVPNDTYATVAVEGFDADAALSAIGAGSWADVAWVATNADGSYAQEYSADAPGFWYDKEGFAGAWGDNASVFATFQEGQILIGQMPGQMTSGSTVTINFSAMYDNKIVENVITVVIIGYEDPETAPEGEPASTSKDITVTQAWNDTYAAVEYDVKEELRQTFKMTTYQIFSAIKSGDLKMWIDEVGSPANENGTPGYTGGAPGYWLDANGKAVGYGDGLVYGELHSSEESLVLAFGNHPENFSPNGGQVKTKYVIELNGVTATYNITYDVTAAAAARKR